MQKNLVLFYYFWFNARFNDLICLSCRNLRIVTKGHKISNLCSQCPGSLKQIWFCKNDLMCQTRGKRILNLKFSWVGQRLPHFLFPLRFYLTFWKGPGKPFKIPDVSEREHGWLVCIWPVCPSLAILEDWPWKWNFCAIWHAHDI